MLDFCIPGWEVWTSLPMWFLHAVLSHTSRLLLMLMGGLAKTRTDKEFSSWFANFSTLGLWFSWKPVFSGTAPKAFWFWINDSKFCFVFLHWFDILLIHFYTNTWKSSVYLLKRCHFLYNFISERGRSIGYGLLIISLLEDERKESYLFLSCSAAWQCSWLPCASLYSYSRNSM